jgi:hypothetical protein
MLNQAMCKRSFIAILALAILAIPARAEPPKREAFEVGVDNALKYLANAQSNDGSWTSGRAFGGAGFNQGGSRDPAITALCVMAFLSAGHVPGEGTYGSVIEKGVRFVSASQQRNGLFAGGQFGMTTMYSHGICTLMVAEVIGLMPDRREAAHLRKQLEDGVKLIRSAQFRGGDRDGGWRYQWQPVDADLSVTAWQIMALRAAKNVGCDIPPETVERAVGYVKRCYDPAVGGYRYTTNSRVTVPCTGAGILSMELCGKEYHASAESQKAGAYLLRKETILKQEQAHFFYGIYYTSQGMFQIGGQYWKVYRQVLHYLLLNQYRPQAGGFWTSRSPDDASAGVNYCTAMAVLALTVEYRFLPIYQRGEEEEERREK